MISRLLVLSAIAFSTIAAQTSNSALIEKLLTAETAVERLAFLSDGDFKYDFTKATSGQTVGAGGFTSSANVLTMPATIGNDISITVGFLGPCGFNTPHIHPRSSEFNYVTNGSLVTGFIEENGARFVYNVVNANQAVIFPQGAVHFEYNNNCKPVTFVAGFSNSFPGVSQVAQRVLDLESDVVAASLGIDQSDVQKYANLTPDNVAFSITECIERCGLNRTGQSTEQKANPTGSTSSPNPSTTTTNKGSLDTTEDDSVKGNLDPGEDSQNKGLIIGLTVAGAVSLGLIALAAFVVFRRRRSRQGLRRDYVRTGESFAPSGMYDSEKYESPSEPFRTPYDPPSGSH